MTNQTENPYLLTHGYEDNHNFPITGYGLTVDSIKYWLFDHHLNVNEVKYAKATSQDPDDITSTEYDEYLADKMPNSTVNYVDTSTAEFAGIMSYSVDPQIHERVTVPSTDDVERDIIKAINVLYDVPDKYQADLKQFVTEYSDYIGVCDFS